MMAASLLIILSKTVNKLGKALPLQLLQIKVSLPKCYSILAFKLGLFYQFNKHRSLKSKLTNHTLLKRFRGLILATFKKFSNFNLKKVPTMFQEVLKLQREESTNNVSMLKKFLFDFCPIYDNLKYTV